MADIPEDLNVDTESDGVGLGEYDVDTDGDRDKDLGYNNYSDGDQDKDEDYVDDQALDPIEFEEDKDIPEEQVEVLETVLSRKQKKKASSQLELNIT